MSTTKIPPPSTELNPVVVAESLRHRRTGKVARLPRATREKLNQLLADGVRYRDIIAQLGSEAAGLSDQNISRWKDGGYRDWLLEQTWLTETRLRQNSASDLASDFDAAQLNQAALQLASLQMFEALRDLSFPLPPNPEGPQNDLNPGAQLAAHTPSADPTERSRHGRPRSKLDFRLGGDSSAFIRMIHALARTARETLHVQQRHAQCSDQNALPSPHAGPFGTRSTPLGTACPGCEQDHLLTPKEPRPGAPPAGFRRKER
jgi:hypothetical protein